MNLDPQVQEVYAKHGAAIGEAQLLERYLGYLVLAVRVPAGSDGFATEMSIGSKQSIGELIRCLRQALPVPSSFLARLDAARVKRNWLAHHYFSDRAEAFQSKAGRTEMIRELDRIGEEFYQLWGYLDAAIVAWLGCQNRTTALLIEEFNRTVREA